ncbi:hypothetical protein [Mesorhizobium sp.]|uniref:hypothetical protein n=1 Tax=Mesorhizobium sp. TaxID=1871066 RepID=UPI000FE677DB|nr:hypothetical protein [Mesorhizobium sp.]RWA69972.1 MAG: hypothetical protein EOQ29_14665 [Mesorhizobium sp.]RWA79888.1 MAG: hypothetical protein EOQ30_23675 [Mesorhizobium sp.]
MLFVHRFHDGEAFLDHLLPKALYPVRLVTVTDKADALAAAAIEGACGTKLSAGHPVWLGFLEAFRTFCLAPPAELQVLMKEIGYRNTQWGSIDQCTGSGNKMVLGSVIAVKST